jgi:hypothetical protein
MLLRIAPVALKTRSGYAGAQTVHVGTFILLSIRYIPLGMNSFPQYAVIIEDIYRSFQIIFFGFGK